MHPRYQEWITHVFDHPVSQRPWHEALDAPVFKATETETAALLAETFSRAGTDLAAFTDAQVNQGLWYLISPACSDHSFSLRSDEVPLDFRLQAIRSIYPLYRDCFAARCSEGLSHLERDGSLLNVLNSICYMFGTSSSSDT
ncbi:hypothetical protein [Luteolibacter sp. Populi]|uniref:hypothetical protein n=1 Tax=Luteolibacter sp. Populi TaxID=3230487 RepID=UPI00346525C7